MRLDMFFTVIAAIVAFFAVRLGDTANLWWKSFLKADVISPGVLIPSVIFVITAALLIVAVIAYFLDYYHDKGSDEFQIEKGVTTVLASFCGFYIYAFFVGPLNNVTAIWLDGWAIVALIGMVPAILNVNFWIRDAVEKSQTDAASSENKVAGEFRHRE